MGASAGARARAFACVYDVCVSPCACLWAGVVYACSFHPRDHKRVFINGCGERKELIH